ncbi:ABC transporter permease [Marinobacterium sp. LSUCC0821]|uniref:ABC transporter permease n=1 Tax=Marinobacterium sp. LSUCC0821 TaxID=2668067 RepID=UPI001451A895|nr:ABC transporter permease [Marinobacterium sp. LSUCC0821]QJD72053.1 ABC transporter permease [Marinobacterium sp. LSUCC0821]
MSSSSLQDKAIGLTVSFFRKEWSGALLAIVILAIAIEMVTDGKPFFHPTNLMTILNNSAAIGVVAGGMTLVILAAGIDLSVGSVMGLIAALTGYICSYWGFPAWAAILSGLAMGAAVGIIHGTLVAYVGMPAFIVTLAGLSVWRGAAHLSTGAKATPKLPETFDLFGRYNPFAGIRDDYKAGELSGFMESVGSFIDAHWMDFFRTFQMSMLIFIVFFILLAMVVSNMRLGRYIYAIGSNEQGSRQAGINTKMYTLYTYVICSLGAALGAMLFLGRAPYAKSDYGQMWELDAIAAVVIGGTSLFGGRGTIIGTFMGVILLKLINNGLTLAQLATFWQMVVLGLIILVAVGLDIVRQSKSALRVQRMMGVVAIVLALFATLTPGSKVISSAVTLHEHNSMVALQAAGTDLAANQTARLLAEPVVAEHAATVAANWQPALLLLVLVVAALLVSITLKRTFALGAAALYAAGAVAVVSMGMAAVAPLLILGAVVLAGLTTVPYMFDRARALSEF